MKPECPIERVPTQLAAIVGLLALGLLPGGVQAANGHCAASSPAHRVAVVELYTSEGCSSCPPADRWLSAIRESGLGADQVLPIALHVDYWDYIGWPDRFADPRFTRRQRELAAQNRLNTIYTPQVVLDGRDWRRWWEAAPFLHAIENINAQKAALDLALAVQWDGDSARVAVTATNGGTLPDRVSVHAGLLESGLASRVTRGENAGETLAHDHVLRAWLPDLGGPGRSLEGRLTVPADARPDRLTWVAMAEGPDGRILQAVSCRF
ncbi:MAG: DUF1223 domain-containing protein [Burkholderiaceae bacterium]